MGGYLTSIITVLLLKDLGSSFVISCEVLLGEFSVMKIL